VITARDTKRSFSGFEGDEPRADVCVKYIGEAQPEDVNVALFLDPSEPKICEIFLYRPLHVISKSNR
jgi:hypothetical protein